MTSLLRHVHTHMHGAPPKHPDRVPLPSTHPHPLLKGGTPEISQKSIKIYQDITILFEDFNFVETPTPTSTHPTPPTPMEDPQIC